MQLNELVAHASVLAHDGGATLLFPLPPSESIAEGVASAYALHAAPNGINWCQWGLVGRAFDYRRGLHHLTSSPPQQRL